MNKHTPDLYAKAAAFYEGSPTGQYDDEAEHALRCHFELLEALKLLSASLPINHKVDAKIVAKCKAAIAKARGEV